jgi:nucleoside-diphosphate-sugar epimerase
VRGFYVGLTVPRAAADHGRVRVLVTGGSGVVGEGAIRALLRRGHQVRLLARRAEGQAPGWPEGVEPWNGDVTRPSSIRGAARGCQAVIHLAGIVREEPPSRTYARVNVEGTRHVLAEAGRARVTRFVHVSSLGADRGRSPYHRSKLAAERLVRRRAGEWVIVRPGNVYGPGDGVMSWLLELQRSWPVLPVVAAGDQPFAPVWYEDLGEALAGVVDPRTASRRVLEIAGPDHTSVHDLLDRLARLTGRSPWRVRVPLAAAAVGLKVADALGLGLRVGASQLTMLDEGNVLPEGAVNALHELGVTPTGLDDGLRRLLEVVPEQLPSQGVGPLVRKVYTADAHRCTRTAIGVQRLGQRRLAQLLPLEADVPARLALGTTFSVNLPLRGVLAMRIVEMKPGRLTAATLDGHPLAGTVTFTFRELGPARVRLGIETTARAAGVLDGVALRAVGFLAQDATWREVLDRLVELSGGAAPAGIQETQDTLVGAQASAAEDGAARLAHDRVRRQRTVAVSSRRGRRRAAGTGSARRSPGGTGSGRTTGRTARRAAARTASRRSR